MIKEHLQGSCISIDAKSWSYQIEIRHGKYLVHRYFGKKLSGISELHQKRSFKKNYGTIHPDRTFNEFSFETELFELTSPGKGDYRIPLFNGRSSKGSSVFSFTYDSHEIMEGILDVHGLPGVYAEEGDSASTLKITCRDEDSGLYVHLYYGVLPEFDTLLRWCCFENRGTDPVSIERAMSFLLDTPEDNFDVLTLQGAYARERTAQRHRLTGGISSFSSLRGISSHHMQPFLGMLSPETGENSGSALGVLLVYSGNFLFEVEKTAYGTVRITSGIHNQGFSWLLEPGESFFTPQAVLVQSYEGLGGMTRSFHRLIRTRLCRTDHRDAQRPVLINNWEATYFDFTRNDLLELADEAHNVGIELFVLDDGWFTNRSDDTTGLGDWQEDRKKLSGGLQELSQDLLKRKLKMGLWVEPEMVSPGTQLMQEHPDWVLGYPEKELTMGRTQLVLDLAHPDVQQHLIDTFTRVFSSADISYVKWDMNRCIGEWRSAYLPPERQGEASHRYVLGLYRVMKELTERFPHILFEGCAGGGGRYDAGILAFMPQYWTSDNTDGVSRLFIQHGTSMVYPLSTMGSHVSEVPNHQVGRSTSLDFRLGVSMAGNFGCELDLRKLTKPEKQVLSKQISWYKRWRPVIQFGDMYRLKSPADGEDSSLMIVSPDKHKAVLFWYRRLHDASLLPPVIHLSGLDPSIRYLEERTGASALGDELMHRGFPVEEPEGDFSVRIYQFVQDENSASRKL